MPEDILRALLLVAGVPYTQLYEITNEYSRIYAGCSAEYRAYAAANPWWLVKTEFGLIKIGWRKRVINIDWSDTYVRTIVTKDDVTKNDVLVHAWSYGDAVNYLLTWMQTAVHQKWRKENPEEAAKQDESRAAFKREQEAREAAKI